MFEQIVIRVSDYIDEKPYLVSCTKGILDDPFRPLSEIISSKLKNTIGVLSGPNLAKEIAEGEVVVKSKDGKVVVEMIEPGLIRQIPCCLLFSVGQE